MCKDIKRGGRLKSVRSGSGGGRSKHRLAVVGTTTDLRWSFRPPLNNKEINNGYRVPRYLHDMRYMVTNDPRGSYSKEVYNDQLQMLGNIKYGRQEPAPAKKVLLKFRTAATPHLSRAPFFIDDNSRPIIAAGFSKVAQRLSIRIAAGAIMNDHVHTRILRSKYRIEYVVNELKGGAAQALKLKRTP